MTTTKLTQSRALAIAEGYEDPESEEQWIAAWQYLIDTGLAWSMQGFFGRTASTMIQNGLCYYPTVKPKKKPVNTGGQTPRTPEEK